MKKLLCICTLLVATAALVFAGTSTPTAAEKLAAAQQAGYSKVLLESDLAVIAAQKAAGTLDVNHPAYQRLLNYYETEFAATRHNDGSLDQGHDVCPATHIGSLNFTDVGSTVGAGNDVDGHHGTGDNGPQVVYEFTAATADPVYVGLCGSSYDTEIIVHTGGACPGASYVTSSDDACGLQSEVTFTPVAGQQYFIIVGGFFSSAGFYFLSVGQSTGYIADDSLTAPGTFVGNTCGAGNNCALRPSEDLIIQVNIPSAGSWRFSLCNDAITFWDSYFELGTGPCLNDVGFIDDGCPDPNYYLSNPGCFELEARSYYVTVEGFSSTSCGDVTLLVEECTPPMGRCCYAPAGGDPYHPLCEDATSARCAELGGEWVEGWNCVDNPCPVYGSCCYDCGLSCADMMTASGCASLGGIWYEGASCANHPCENSGVPANDDCANATVIAALPYADAGNTCCATDDYVVLGCGFESANPDVVYALRLDHCAHVTVSLCGSSFDTEIGVSTVCGDNSTEVACNDDSFCGLQSNLTFFAETGTVYYIYVGGFGSSCGNFTLEIIEDPAPCPCVPEDAYFDAAMPVPQYACWNLCDGGAIRKVYVLNQPDPAAIPIVVVTPGCDPLQGSRCDRDCEAATYFEWTTDWYWMDDHFCRDAIGNGCVCLCLEGFLAVELNNFSCIAGNNSVTLNWSTATENQNDRFEIMRDGVLTGTVVSQGNSSSAQSYSWTDNSAVNGRTYSYALIAVSVNGNRDELRTEAVTPVFNGGIVTEYALLQNYPNPFNPSTQIAFNLPEAAFVTLKVYNVLGHEVATLVNGEIEAGAHNVSFDATNLTSGVYLYRITSGSFSAEKKMVLMK